MAAPHLDKNERAMLDVFQQQDPDAKNWICPWALGERALIQAGGDLIGATMHGSMSVARRLASRKMLDAEPNVRGTHRGYAINDKGRAALAAAKEA